MGTLENLLMNCLQARIILNHQLTCAAQQWLLTSVSQKKEKMEKKYATVQGFARGMTKTFFKTRRNHPESRRVLCFLLYSQFIITSSTAQYVKCANIYGVIYLGIPDVKHEFGSALCILIYAITSPQWSIGEKPEICVLATLGADGFFKENHFIRRTSAYLNWVTSLCIVSN